MRISKAAVAATLSLGVAATVVYAAPVHAATEVVTDPAGDAGGAARLDVTRVAVSNRDDKVVARVRFAEDRRGALIVGLDARGGSGLRMIARKRTDGSVRAWLLPGALVDRGRLEDVTACRGLRVRWAEDVARLAMPSRCLQGGDYGAVRFSVLTENGSDSDFAPDRDRTSGWVARG